MSTLQAHLAFGIDFATDLWAFADCQDNQDKQNLEEELREYQLEILEYNTIDDRRHAVVYSATGESSTGTKPSFVEKLDDTRFASQAFEDAAEDLHWLKEGGMANWLLLAYSEEP